MKKIMILLLATVLTACSTLTPAEKAERKAKTAQAVEKALTERRYKVDISMMLTNRGTAVNVTSNYSLEVKGDTLVSYLPYFGRAYQMPYGGGKGLNFTAPISDYHAEKDHRGTYQININVKNEEDDYSYHLEVFDNGSTTIHLTTRQRDPISYSGDLDLRE